MKMSVNEVLRRITSFLIPYLLILSICLLIKLIYTKADIYFAVNRLNSSVVDFLAPFVTDIGNGWTAVAIAALFALFSYRKALIIASSYAVTSITAQILKYIIC